MNFARRYFIHDILDAPAPYKEVVNSSVEFSMSFKVDDLSYLFGASLLKETSLIAENEEDFISGIDVWIIDFEALTKSGKGGFDIINVGNQFTVFATVGAIMKEFIKSKKPEYFSFSAKEKSRVRLYKIFAIRMAKEFNYKWWQYSTDGGVYFAFMRK